MNAPQAHANLDTSPSNSTRLDATPVAQRQRSLATRLARAVVPFVVVAGSILGSVFIWGVQRFDSVGDALLYLEGVRFVVEPTIVLVGTGRPGESKDATFRVRNLSDMAVTILGCHASCSCVAVEDLPVALAPHAARELHVRIKLSPEPDENNQNLTYFTNQVRSPQFDVRVRGRLVEP